MSSQIHCPCCCKGCNKPKKPKAKVFDELGPLPPFPAQLTGGALWIPVKISLQKAMDAWHSVYGAEEVSGP